ncbi:MAG: hypothetical protein SGARI_002536 [Bacillariaceae sp.]
MLPDIRIENYPHTTSQGVPVCGTAIFELKGVRQIRSFYSLNSRGCDSRARAVRTEHLRRVREFDELFCNIARDPDSPDIKGPFQKCYESHVTKGSIPLVFGAFGETNTTTMDGFLRTLAAVGGRTSSGLRLSPHPEGSSRASSKDILLRKYRQALGVMIARVHADLILLRLRFIHPTISAARQAAKNASRQYGSQGFARGAPPWFASSDDDPYGPFHEFCEGRRRDTDFFGGAR